MMIGQRPDRSNRDLAEPSDDRIETRHDRTETRLSQMTIGQNSVVRWSRCRNREADENYSDQQAEGTRSASGGQSATEKVSATKRRSKRLDTQAKEEIHASEKIGAARASEVDRLMALVRGLGPRSLAARPDKTATGKHWRQKNSDQSHERENLKLGRVMALLGRQNRRRKNSGR
jgi:hypothetical protein